MQIPATTSRVPENTAAYINERIRQGIANRLDYYARHPEEIDRRLKELDQEWDIERTLEANAAAFGLAGLGLALMIDRRFLALTGGVLGFLMQHAIQGWCPPVPIFRRRGVRTTQEIDTERDALKTLRGDYDDIRHDSDIERILTTH